jgi:hypothetical protein
VLELTDEQGQPLANHDVIVALPAGPLTDRLRVSTLTSDGKGMVWLDGFAAGQLTVTTAETRAKRTVEIPPLAAVPTESPMREQDNN